MQLTPHRSIELIDALDRALTARERAAAEAAIVDYTGFAPELVSDWVCEQRILNAETTDSLGGDVQYCVAPGDCASVMARMHEDSLDGIA